ncbi:MAG: DUF4827 domain-containing protein [Bacteroidales bacterium]|nr:DUF4827 domain-containing protein [Bacteroidales bacterium]
MKKISIYILLFMGVALASCNNNTYSNALKEEQKLIENFIARQGIKVVTEKPTEWGDKVYWKVPDKDNYYFHLVEVGDTTKPALEAKDKVNLRYIQYTLDAYADTTRFWNSDDQPKPTELQYMVYTESTCEGWQIALEHMQYTGAQCKIICPSKLGFTNQNSNVIPYGYDMKIQIKRF